MEAAAPLWWFHAAATPAGAWAVSTQGVGAVLLLTLAVLRLPVTTKAWAALVTTALIGLAVASSADLRGSLFGGLPGGLGQGGLHIALGLTALVTALRFRTLGAGRGPALALLVAAAVLFAAMYLSRGPAGTIGSLAKESLLSVLVLPPHRAAWTAHLTHFVLAALWAGILAVGGYAVLRRYPPTHGWAAWVLTIFALALTTVGFKSAIATGDSVPALLALRTVALVVGLAVVWAFATTGLTPRYAAGAAVSTAVLLSAGLLGLSETQSALQHSHATAHPAWRLDRPRPRIQRLFAEALPTMVHEAERTAARGETARDGPGGMRLRSAAARARALASDLPALASALGDLADVLTAPDRKRRRIAQLAERINEINRKEGLPFFVDLRVFAQRGPQRYPRFFTHLKTYRIERVHRPMIGRRPVEILWVRRIDPLSPAEDELGWTAHHARHGVVILDAVESLWDRELGPALAEGATGFDRGSYRRHAHELIDELARAVGTSREAILALARCTVRPRGVPCRPAWLRRPVLRALAYKVEAHEVQHVLDRGAPSSPAALRSLMTGYSAEALATATAELSAYLAEIARTHLPRLALAHLLELGRRQPHSAEGFVRHAALQHLTRGGSLDPSALFRLPSHEISARAQRAWETFFERPLEGGPARPPLAM